MKMQVAKLILVDAGKSNGEYYFKSMMPWFAAYDHRHETVINRWSITYNEGVCATLAEDTRSCFGLTHDDEDTKNQKISHLPIGECL